MKITVIDLLQEISDGEISKKVRWFKRSQDWRICSLEDLYCSLQDEDVYLGDEIEIIEEDKPTEKIFGLHHPTTNKLDLMREDIELAFETIDKLIDKVNELEKENSIL